ncbi:MAG TPA: alpha/beta fold hydrolase [Casimicrobiaceae bacterium]|nr:alpha/beta fold hydrolase [Casimicrobiaceae bacterium]
MIANGFYRAPLWLPGGHAQTIYPAFAPRPAVKYRRQRIDTPDGDFVDFDWLETAQPRGDAPLVVLFHGLEGSSASHYALALMAQLSVLGWRGVVPHFRGCSGEPNRLARAYHSGDYAEVGWMLQTIRSLEPNSTIFVVGVSLGGSALLNWLGREEHRAREILAAAAAVSTPLDLTAAGISIGQGLNRIYSRHFLSTLVPKALAMARRFPGSLDPGAIALADTMYRFDEIVTAPLHGFGGARDYWKRASSKPWLKAIAVRTLVLNARNDPFVPAASLPGPADVSATVVLEQPHDGGHVGFLTGPFPGHLNWLPTRLLQFFRH